MRRVTSETRERVEQQGYLGLPDEAVADVDRCLRFESLWSGVWIAAGLWAGSPLMLWLTVPLAVAGAVRQHPFNLICNHLSRRAGGSTRIPLPPAPKRFAFIVDAAGIASSAVCLTAGATEIGIAIGAVVLATPLAHVTTGMCVWSWFYGIVRGRPV